MRSARQFENSYSHVEWMHPGAWRQLRCVLCGAQLSLAKRTGYPMAFEVQMLELDWVNLNKRNGETPR
jgi:hypothetical protein